MGPRAGSQISMAQCPHAARARVQGKGTARTAHDLGYPVLALLPLEVDDYAADFTGDEQPLS